MKAIAVRPVFFAWVALSFFARGAAADSLIHDTYSSLQMPDELAVFEDADDAELFDFQAIRKARSPLQAIFAGVEGRVGAEFGPHDVFRYHADQMFVPASVTKIFIAALGLDALGPEYRFRSHLRYRLSADGTASDLVLLAHGDPSVGVAELERERGTIFERFARRLTAEGVRRVHGPIEVAALDPRWLDREIRPTQWAARHHGRCYGAFASAAMLAGNCAGGRAVENSNAGWATRMKAALVEAGVAIDTKARSSGGEFAEQIEYSPPLREIIRPFVKHSINIFGEAILLQVGAAFARPGEGFRAHSLERLQAFLHDFSSTYPREIRLHDGCGLADSNRASPRATTAFLEAAERTPWFDAFFASLAIAGRDGTLRSRMRGTIAAGRVRAKTGTLSGIATLAGYLTAADDDATPREAFAIFGKGNVSAIRKAMDRAVVVRLSDR